MIPLHLIPTVSYDCPHCCVAMRADGWYMPGMWMLATLRCDQCGRCYYGHLASGHGVYSLPLLEAETGVVHGSGRRDWLALRLHEAYAKRTAEPLPLTVERLRPVCCRRRTQARSFNCWQ